MFTMTAFILQRQSRLVVMETVQLPKPVILGYYLALYGRHLLIAALNCLPASSPVSFHLSSILLPSTVVSLKHSNQHIQSPWLNPLSGSCCLWDGLFNVAQKALQVQLSYLFLSYFPSEISYSNLFMC